MGQPLPHPAWQTFTQQPRNGISPADSIAKPTYIDGVSGIFPIYAKFYFSGHLTPLVTMVAKHSRALPIPEECDPFGHNGEAQWPTLAMPGHTRLPSVSFP